MNVTTGEIVNGVKRRWIAEGTICAYQIEVLSMQTLDLWNRDVITTLTAADSALPTFGLLYDLSASGVSMPYLIYCYRRIDEIVILPQPKMQLNLLLRDRAPLRIALALVIASSMSGAIALGRGRRVHDPASTDADDRIHAQAFFAAPDAEAWLRLQVM